MKQPSQVQASSLPPSRSQTVTSKWSTFAWHIPMVLSFWLLAAHFLRFGNTLFCLVLVSMPLLFLIKRKLVLYTNQVFLCLGALFWVVVTYNMLNQRLMMGEDWTRLLFIMSGVVLFTLLSACCGLHHKVQNRYH